MRTTEYNETQKNKLLTLKKVNKESGCWEFTQSTAKSGYGQISFNGKRGLLVHRVSYAMFNGDIPDGMFVRHTCDNRKCFNPEHLVLGTNADNMQDVRDRGTGKVVTGSGEEHYNSVWTERDILAIRAMALEAEDWTTAEIAEKVGKGITPNEVFRIVTGRTWINTPGAVSRGHFNHANRAKRARERGTKRCISCQQMLPLSEYGLRSSLPGGIAHKCKPCISPNAKFRRSESDTKRRTKA